MPISPLIFLLAHQAVMFLNEPYFIILLTKVTVDNFTLIGTIGTTLYSKIMTNIHYTHMYVEGNSAVGHTYQIVLLIYFLKI